MTTRERTRRPKATEWNTEAIQQALASNRKLQAAILSELETISRHKARNRVKVTRKRSELLGSFPIKNKRTADGRQTVDRKWQRRFFVGPDGSAPEPNEDTKRRRALEDGTFLFHKQPPWSKRESTALQQLVKDTQQTTGNNAQIDFGAVAQRLNANKKQPISRSADECRIHFNSLQRKVRPFSKDESRKISEQVHLNAQPDWQEIAKSLVNRTAWECLVAYQSKLKPVEAQVWTPEEDELLLKYIAAAGPQFVVDGESVKHLCNRLFPDKSKSSVLSRINQSLVNPNMKKDNWTDEEERRLAILMKIYRDSNQPLYMASTHLADRSTKSVADKWNRALSPEFSSRPFTKEEDERLVAIVRKHASIGWTELSETHFHARHPQRLANRWAELADDKDIIARSGHTLVRERKRGAAADVAGGAALTADDYVVQINSKKPTR